jgi:hypothetical protein
VNSKMCGASSLPLPETDQLGYERVPSGEAMNAIAKLTMPLLVIQRLPFARGVGFEVEERGTVGESMRLGDFNLVDKVRVAQQHYSTGMALLAGEDAVSGLIDAAFTQFYLPIEATLECHERDEALTQGARFFREQFDENLGKIVSHVYLARHRFFGHAHPKYRRGLLDTKTAFDIAKHWLPDWTARRLLELALARPLVKREMRLYPGPGRSLGFSGDASSLGEDFALPT